MQSQSELNFIVVYFEPCFSVVFFVEFQEKTCDANGNMICDGEFTFEYDEGNNVK